MVREQLAAEAEDDNETLSWEHLTQRNVRLSNTVYFGRSAVDAGGLRDRPRYAITNHSANDTLYGAGPDYVSAAAGQSVRRVQPQQDRGPQRVSHLVV